MERRGTYVAVTGPIAAGASTLAMTIKEQLGWRTFEETAPHQHNEFFVEATSDFPRWGFHSQVNFATASAERHAELRAALFEETDDIPPIVEERTPFEHREAYTRAYSALGMINRKEAALLDRLGIILARTYVTPNLLIYRRARHDDMIARIKQRQRPGESTVPPEVLIAIENAFDEMMGNWTRSPILVVEEEVDMLKFDEAQNIVKRIKRLVETL